MIKATYAKPTYNIILNVGKLKAISLNHEQVMVAHSHHYYPIWKGGSEIFTISK